MKPGLIAGKCSRNGWRRRSFATAALRTCFSLWLLLAVLGSVGGAETTAFVERAVEAQTIPARSAPIGDSAKRQNADRIVSTPTGSLFGTITLRDPQGKANPDRAGVIVYLAMAPEQTVVASKLRHQLRLNKNGFTSNVLATTLGSTVEFGRADRACHGPNVRIHDDDFQLGVCCSEGRSFTFTHTGIADVTCILHPKEWAQILVLDHPFFTTAGKDGRFELAGLPPGTYQVAAWARGGAPSSQEVTIEPGKRVQVWLTASEGRLRSTAPPSDRVVSILALLSELKRIFSRPSVSVNDIVAKIWYAENAWHPLGIQKMTITQKSNGLVDDLTLDLEPSAQPTMGALHILFGPDRMIMGYGFHGWRSTRFSLPGQGESNAYIYAELPRCDDWHSDVITGGPCLYPRNDQRVVQLKFRSRSTE